MNDTMPSIRHSTRCAKCRGVILDHKPISTHNSVGFLVVGVVVGFVPTRLLSHAPKNSSRSIAVGSGALPVTQNGGIPVPPIIWQAQPAQTTVIIHNYVS